MKKSKLRRQIAWQAAKLMYDREESEYYQAKMKAARKLQIGWVKPKDLPSNAEIRDEIERLAHSFEGEQRKISLFEMRVAALGMMKKLSKFKPKIIGSVLTGHIRNGSDIDLHIFSDSLQSVLNELEFHNLPYDVTRKKIRRGGQETIYRHVHVADEFQFELTVYRQSMVSHVFKSSITGKPIDRCSIAEFELFLSMQHPMDEIEGQIQRLEDRIDRFQYFESLMLPLENVKQNPLYHPEGDALYHSLQVFDLAVDRLPYDEEFLLAALLHDVGKGIDVRDHVNAGLEAIAQFVTERTYWLVQNHMVAHQIFDRSIGARKWRRLRENESYEDLVSLGECDRSGRQVGVATRSLDEALEYCRDLSTKFG